MVAVQKGERPRKPENAESLGFSVALWWLVRMCWSESPSARPTAQELLRCLQDASPTWVPPPEYPIHDGGVGFDATFDDERGPVAGVLTGNLFVLMVGVLCILLLPFA